MLTFGIKPPLSFEKFLELCEKFIPSEDIGIIRIVLEKPGYSYSGQQPTLKKWFDFDALLRNELVKVRAIHKHIDPAKYLRRDSFAGQEIMHLALSAHRNPSILEGEKLLDQARWQALEEFSLGHFFDLDFLIVYAWKLLILERWERIREHERKENRQYH